MRKISVLRDIESAESKILSDGAASSLVEDIDIESEVSIHPQYVIKEDLFETVDPLLAMSLVLNKLELKQSGNCIKIKFVIGSVLITSIYDEQMHFPMNLQFRAEERLLWVDHSYVHTMKIQSVRHHYKLSMVNTQTLQTQTCHDNR